ncbi:MAG: hypothetical protein AAF441_18760 [Pseudomonadota bacterium]
MRIWSLTAAVILALVQWGVAQAQESKSTLEHAKKFCAEKYGDRLLGVALDDTQRFSCRFAAVTRTESFKIASSQKQAKAQPAWDLDDEDDAGSSDQPQTTASVATDSSNSESALALAPALTPAKDAKLRKKAKKRRYRKRRSRKQRYRRRKTDPFASLFKNIPKISKRRKYRRRVVRRRYRTNVRRRRR